MIAEDFIYCLENQYDTYKNQEYWLKSSSISSAVVRVSSLRAKLYKSLNLNDRIFKKFPVKDNQNQ